MKQDFDAIYENGAFHPIRPQEVGVTEGQRVHLSLDENGEGDSLRLAGHVYEGLDERQVEEIEAIALNRRHFFDTRSPD